MRRIMVLFALFGFSSIISTEMMQIEERTNPKKRELEYKSEPETKRQATEFIKHIYALDSMPEAEQIPYVEGLLKKLPRFDLWTREGKIQLLPFETVQRYNSQWSDLKNILVTQIKEATPDMRREYARLALKYEQSLGEASFIARLADAVVKNLSNSLLKRVLKVLVENATDQQKFNALYATLAYQLLWSDDFEDKDLALDKAMHILEILFEAGINPTVKNSDGSTIIAYLGEFGLMPHQIILLSSFIASHSQ